MKKLYDEDAYMRDFSAKTESCEKREGEYCVVLNQTAFFPTAGGQDCDTGVLDGQRVLHVEMESGIVLHFVKEPIEIGKTVSGKIDWEARFRKMQHHSAEHIISGLAHSIYGLDNVGFHLSDREVTMDYNGELSEEEVTLLENAANTAVQENLMITAEYPDKDKLSSMNYRSKLDLEDNVRIVTVEGIDVCACCAPHVKRTGEIGMIKLTDVMRHRGGVRMRMICGMDALRDYQKKQTEVQKISCLLSSKQNEVSEAVDRKLEEITGLKQRISELSGRLAESMAEQIDETDGNICIFECSENMHILRNVVNIAKKKCTGFAAVMAGDDKEGYNYIISSDSVPLRSFSEKINNALNGRGGGRDDMLQGHFSADRRTIERFLAELK
ncbi:MAG: alanine--tRNA ligase-related protein [Clostridiales bacterium]|nr:alanine--tRNA ligase-related protein [Clostridiales bacterium]